ncbi:hypothetical protein ES703_38341 [subsurface metagenome]
MEWMDEPNRQEFEHAGLKCLILRHYEMLQLNGYVGVPKNHPWYGIDYSQCLRGCEGKPNEIDPRTTSYPCTWESDHESPEKLIDVHGGLTFSGMEDDELRPAGYWWFGFDCAHAWDLVPQILELIGREPREHETYRNFAYVRAEVKSLAEQLAKVKQREEELKQLGIDPAFL